jgi:hypothetical protein
LISYYNRFKKKTLFGNVYTLKKAFVLHHNSLSFLTFPNARGVYGIQLPNGDQILALSHCKNVKYDSSFAQSKNGTFVRVLEFCCVEEELFALVRTFTLVSEPMKDFHLGILNVEVEILKASDIYALAVAVPKYVGATETFYVCQIIRPHPHVDTNKKIESSTLTPIVAQNVTRILQQNLRLPFSNLTTTNANLLIQNSSRLLNNLSEWWSGSLVNLFFLLLEDNSSVFAMESCWHQCSPTSHFWDWTHNTTVIKTVRDSHQNVMVLLPVCHNQHWTLLAVVKIKGKVTVYHFDSGSRFQLVSQSDLKQWVSILTSKKLFAIEGTIEIKKHYYITQPDVDSCGFYVCKFAEILSRNFYRIDSWKMLLQNYFNSSYFKINDEKTAFLKRLSNE